MLTKRGECKIYDSHVSPSASNIKQMFFLRRFSLSLFFFLYWVINTRLCTVNVYIYIFIEGSCLRAAFKAEGRLAAAVQRGRGESNRVPRPDAGKELDCIRLEGRRKPLLPVVVVLLHLMDAFRTDDIGRRSVGSVEGSDRPLDD